jgi:septum formation protein
MNELSAGAKLLGFRGEPLILASRSPRRQQLLQMLGLRFRVQIPEIVEKSHLASRTVAEYVEFLAGEKASSVAAGSVGYAVLGADTVVHCDQEILEKPCDEAHARSLLRRLSGCWHEVFTGVCLLRLADGRRVVGHERSRVRFSDLTPEEIDLYVATGEPMDKAGAYGIQGYGGMLVDRIEGCYFNVMGLPLPLLRRLGHELEGI